MALSGKQKQNIQHLDAQTCIEIMHECAESLGLITVADYAEMTKQHRRTVYDKISNNKISNTEFLGQKLIIMNDK